jgi:predicted nuclease of predicted toxin-antitoxin system
MKFKLDENLGSRAAELITQSGHDVETVSQERLNGAIDEALFAICRAEHRVLITLDLDFADVLRFPPARSPGIVVLRPPHTASLTLLRALVRELLTALQTETIEGRLWVVEAGRIRVHQSTTDDAP